MLTDKHGVLLPYKRVTAFFDCGFDVRATQFGAGFGVVIIVLENANE